jgi:hypothetical protein
LIYEDNLDQALSNMQMASKKLQVFKFQFTTDSRRGLCSINWNQITGIRVTSS